MKAHFKEKQSLIHKISVFHLKFRENRVLTISQKMPPIFKITFEK